MNKTKIEWTQFSWNPITGCDHGCWYCYANKLFTRFHKSFRPTFYPERLGELKQFNLKHREPVKIFVCSVSDLFAPWTPIEWRNQVLHTMECSEIPHWFQTLTKNPERIPRDYDFPDNVWVGTTVTTENGDIKNIEEIKQVNGNRFVSFEPLLGSIEGGCNLKEIDWVIIGQLTGAKKVKLRFEWLAEILDMTGDYQIPVFMKNNLRQTFPDLRLLQEFPKEFKPAS